ncbi:MAG: hypothetical protein ACLPX5_05150 [Dissulfurispiraceae bacterium]
MAIKTEVVEAALGEKFKIESGIGKQALYMGQPVAMGGPTPVQIHSSIFFCRWQTALQR